MSDIPGVTYDAMHLTDDGIALMLTTIVAQMPPLTADMAGAMAAAAPEP